MSDSILLEVGTGELEVIVFTVNNCTYCINVLKSREIVQLEDIRPICGQDKSILGISNIRGTIMSVIDLSYILNGIETDLSAKKMALICEFNQQKVIFAVDSILGINRIRWEDIVKPDNIGKTSLSVGNILTKDNTILMMLDFEKILTDLTRNDSPVQDKISRREERTAKHIYMADDSKVIREMLKGTLREAGYTNIHEFDNGKDLITSILNIKQAHGANFNKEVDLVITDIEMPIMDGHTVTRTIKEDEVLKKLPVVIYSSLITEDLFHKGEKVGADRQISKPSIGELIGAIDSLLY